MSVCPADLRNPLRHLTKVIRKHDFEDIDHSDKTTPRQSWRPETERHFTEFVIFAEGATIVQLPCILQQLVLHTTFNLLRSQNMEIKGKQKNFNEKMMKRGKKLVESRSQARAAFLLPQLSDIPMKAHKLGVALRRPTKSRKKRNATEGFREKQLQQMFWRLLAFESWLKVVSAFERERGGEGKLKEV